MHDFNSFGWQLSTMHAQRPTDSWENRNHNVVWKAVRLYERVCWHGRLARLFAWLQRRPYRLLSLAAVEQQCQISNQYHAGIQTISINQIRGSDGRSHDFDSGFRPRQTHSRQRWLGVAMAWMAGEPVPPVELIQVGTVYFVRDGHHRISVARALGQQEIEAVVTAWQVTSLLPWEPTWVGTRIGVGAPVT